MNRNSKGILIALVIIALLAIGRWQVKQTEDKTTNSQTATTQQRKIVVADIGWAGLAPFYVADEKNLFGDSIDVEIVKISSIGDIRTSMQAGNVDIYQGTYDMYLSNDGKKAPGIGFMAGDESFGADALIMQSSFNSLADLKGKTIALEKGTPGYLLLQYIAAKDGLTLKDFNIKYMPVADAAAAFIAGQVDAAGTYEPYITNAIKAVSGAKVLSSSKDFPGVFPAIYFASQDLIDNPQYLKDFFLGWTKALEYIDSNTDEAYTIMANAYSISTGDMKDLKTGIIWHNAEGNAKLFNKSMAGNVYEIFASVKEIMKNNGDNVATNESQDSLTSAIVSK